MQQRSKDRSHVSSGLRKILEAPAIFNFWQKITGAERWKRRIIVEFVNPGANAKILDIGCGTGSILKLIDKNLNVEYVGCDVNRAYIDSTQKIKRGKSRFYCCKAEDIPLHESGFDIVLCIAVVHHLSNESSKELVRSIKQKLNPGGMFLLAEPVWTSKQSAIEKYIMQQAKRKRYTER